MKLHLTPAKPRNPFAQAARQRAAGTHRRCQHGQRQRAQTELRQTLERERYPSP